MSIIIFFVLAVNQNDRGYQKRNVDFISANFLNGLLGKSKLLSDEKFALKYFGFFSSLEYVRNFGLQRWSLWTHDL